MTPKVSVMIPSYNHEPYVAEAVESVLNQTFTDFELLISDDASPDRSAEILQRYDDPRIDLHLSSENQGATLNLQYLVDKCRGEYVALNNSDDVWLPQRLEKGVAYLDAHPECGAVFSQAALIDENSHVLTADCEIFHQPNRTRAEWYRHFFTKANCLCHPSVLIRRSVYEQIGCYTMGMRQL
ncbi:MAG: glycosyltransferase, partial [Eubacteriales bacterium]|nr:glycosyltransferase [Eubacteriales bacterium]